MKLILLAFLTITTITFGQNYDNWKTYISEEVNLSIGFPGTAEVEVINYDGNLKKTISHRLKEENNFYESTVSVINSATNENWDQTIVDMILEGLDEQGTANYTQSVWKVQGEEGIEAKIMFLEEGYFHIRTVSKGNISYCLVVYSQNEDLTVDQAEQFFSTFRITE